MSLGRGVYGALLFMVRHRPLTAAALALDFRIGSLYSGSGYFLLAGPRIDRTIPLAGTNTGAFMVNITPTRGCSPKARAVQPPEPKFC